MKNKKLLKTIAIIIPVLLIGLMVYLFFNFQKRKKKVEALKNIPTFSVKDIDGNLLTQNDIPQGNKVLVYFNPGCEYCQAEMEELSQINEKHMDINWMLFTDKKEFTFHRVVMKLGLFRMRLNKKKSTRHWKSSKNLNILKNEFKKICVICKICEKKQIRFKFS